MWSLMFWIDIVLSYLCDAVCCVVGMLLLSVCICTALDEDLQWLLRTAKKNAWGGALNACWWDTNKWIFLEVNGKSAGKSYKRYKQVNGRPKLHKQFTNFFWSDELVYTRKIRKVKKIELVRFLYALNRVATQGKPRGTVKRFEQVHQSKKEKV